MNKVQFLKTDAGEIAIMPRAEYDRLMRAIQDEREEDEGTARLLRRSRARIARGEEVAIPMEVVKRLEAGENPVRVIREWREIKQGELARTLGIAQGYLSDIESGKRRGTARLLAKVGRALRVPLDLLIDERDTQ